MERVYNITYHRKLKQVQVHLEEAHAALQQQQDKNERVLEMIKDTAMPGENAEQLKQLSHEVGLLQMQVVESLNLCSEACVVKAATKSGSGSGSELESHTITDAGSCLVMHPGSLRRICWDLLVLGFVLYDLVVIPLRVFDLPASPFRDAVGYVAAPFWCADLLAQFFVGYTTNRPMRVGFAVELRPGATARRYLTTWLAIDLFALVLTWASYPNGQNLDLVWFAGALVFMRFLRLVRMRYFNALVEQRCWAMCAVLYQVTLLLFAVVVVSHYAACGWYAAGRPVDGSTEGWVNRFSLQDKSLGDRYLAALHWAVGQFTLAGSDIAPVGPEERLYAVAVPLLAVVVLYPVFGRIVIVMNQLWVSDGKRTKTEA